MSLNSSSINQYPYNITNKCFISYDIRGKFGEELFAQDAYFIGKAFASMILKYSNTHGVYICCDGRNSSPILETNLINGLKESKINITSLTLGPTALMYYATKTGSFEHGVMITGSHNDHNYNGFKLVLNKQSLIKPQIEELYQIINKAEYLSNKQAKYKYDVDLKLIDNYYNDLIATHSLLNRTLNIVWDPGHGATSDIITRITKKLAGKHLIINNHVNGNFPNRHPNPLNENVQEQLKKIVLQKKCELAIAFDGDGDRVVFVDDTGSMIKPEHVAAIFLEHMLSKKNKITIVVDNKTSQWFLDWCDQKQIIVNISSIGHSNIKHKVKQQKADFAFETSGHYYFTDKHYGYDDGIYTALRFLEIISLKTITLSEFIKHQLPYYLDSKDFRINTQKANNIVNLIKDQLNAKHIEFSTIDGIRVKEKEGYWIIRDSNTEPVINIRFGAKNSEEYILIQKKLHKLLKNFNIELKKF